MLLLVFGLAMAAVPQSIRSFPESIEDLSKALKKDDKRFRRYAVRTLKGEVRRAVSSLDSIDQIERLEARQSLGDYELYTVPACIDQIETRDVGPGCVVIIRHLEAGAAYAAVKRATSNETLSYWHKHQLSKTLQFLEEQ